MAALITLAAIWLLLRSALLLHQAELRRRGLVGTPPFTP